MNVKYKEVKTIREFIDAVRLRVEVFILEQGSKPGWEPDENDKSSRNYVAIADGKVVSTARFRESAQGEIKIERMATRKECRGKGIGAGLLEFMLKEIKKSKPKRIWAMCQVRSQPFYERYGFEAISKPYDIYGMMHVDTEYKKK